MSDGGLGENIGGGKPRVQKAKNSTPERVRIILEENEGIPPIGLFLQHNGQPYLLKPGMEVDVPIGVIGILDDAVQSKPVVDPQTRQVTGYRDSMRFPYRRVRSKKTDDDEAT